MKTIIALFFLASNLPAQTPSPEFTCSGPVSCGENISQEMGTFFGDLTQGISGEPELMSESEFKALETKIGSKEDSDILKFEGIYSEKNNVEAPERVMGAFQKWRLKLDIRDTNIGFVNGSENKMLGHSGPESKPKDMVDVELPEYTKTPLKNAKKKKPGRPEAN